MIDSDPFPIERDRHVLSRRNRLRRIPDDKDDQGRP